MAEPLCDSAKALRFETVVKFLVDKGAKPGRTR